MAPKVELSEKVLRDVRCNDFDARVDAAVAGTDNHRVALYDVFQAEGKSPLPKKTETK